MLSSETDSRAIQLPVDEPSPSPTPILSRHAPDIVQTLISKPTGKRGEATITEYIIEGLDQGPPLFNSSLAQYQINNTNGLSSLSYGQILPIPIPLSVNTLDGFDEDEEKEVLFDSDDEWPYCSKLYSPKVKNVSDQVQSGHSSDNRQEISMKLDISAEQQFNFSTNDCEGLPLTANSDTTYDGWSSERTLIDEEEDLELNVANEPQVSQSSLTDNIVLGEAEVVAVEERTLVDLTYLTMEYGIPPETVQHYQITNPDPDGPFGPYGSYGLDWFLIPHYPDFIIQGYHTSQNIETFEHLRVDVDMVEQEAQQAVAPQP